MYVARREECKLAGEERKGATDFCVERRFDANMTNRRETPVSRQLTLLFVYRFWNESETSCCCLVD